MINFSNFSYFFRSYCFCSKFAKRRYHSSSKRFQELKNNQTNKKKMPTHGLRNRYKIPLFTGIFIGSSYYIYKSDPFGKFSSPEKIEIIEPKVKSKIEDLPDSVRYLLIGGGTASFAASRSIRANDPKAKVVIISEEEYFPYMRPPLSKELFYTNKELAQNLTFKQWNGKERKVFFEHEEFYSPLKTLMESETGGVTVLKGCKVIKLDAINNRAYLDTGQDIGFEKCLIATGGKPKSLEVCENLPTSIKNKILLFRGIDDFLKLEKNFQNIKSLTIIGGGFLGSELACALGKRAQLSKEPQIINQTFPELGNLSKVLPQYLSQWTTTKIRNEGVNIIPNVDLVSIKETKDNRLDLKFNNGINLETDYVVVAVGLNPNVELASFAGLELDEVQGGYLVNSELQARSNIWVAGDACCFFDIKLGRRRVEHHDHAVVSGRLAGENMTGAKKPYWHQSMFWSDLGPEIGFEAIGLIDSSLPTVGVFSKPDPESEPVSKTDLNSDPKLDFDSKPDSNFKIDFDSNSESKKTEDNITDSKKVGSKPEDSNMKVLRAPEPNDDFNKGVVFYLKNNKVVGILLWNVFNRMSIARGIINEGKSYEDLSEVAKLFNIKSKE